MVLIERLKQDIEERAKTIKRVPIKDRYTKINSPLFKL